MVRRQAAGAAASAPSILRPSHGGRRNVRGGQQDRIPARRWGVMVRSPGAADRWVVDPDCLTFGAQPEAYSWTNKKAAQFFVAVMRHKTTRFTRMIPSVLK
jgi:hypothetical protein